MQELLLVNPAARGKSRRKPRSAAQKAATRRLVAMNRGKSAPRKRRTARASNPISNIKRRSARRRNPIAARRRSRRRNPIAGKPMSILHPALIGALGATTVNTVVAQLGSLLPASMMTGNMLLVTKAVAAIGLAVVGEKVGMKGSTVTQMAEGSLTVTLHDAILMLAQSAGVTQLSGMRAYPPRQNLPRGVATPKLGMHVSGMGNVSQLLPAQRQKMSGFGF